MKYLSKITLILIVAFAFVPMACTDLDIEPDSELTGEKLFADPDNLIFAFGAAYTNVYFTVGHKYGLVGMDCGTDMMVVPQRGGDWFDGGEWHRWHRHSIEPRDNYTNHWWNNCYAGINLCNQLIFQFEAIKDEVETAEQAIVELRAYRALYYYWLVDLFGNVPIVTDFDVPADFAPSTAPREEVFEFIERELTEAIAAVDEETGDPLLSTSADLSDYGRVNYYVAHMILAKLYMNAEVYTGVQRYDDAEDALDVIIESGKYSLAPNYLDNYQDDGFASPEIILGVPFDEVNAEGFEIHLFTLHYNLQDQYDLTMQPWNGICMQESIFNLFEDNDARLGGILFGFQEDAEGNQIEDPSYERFDPSNPTGPRDPDGPPLNLSPEINMLEPNCLRQAGVRLQKYEFIPETDRYTSNDFPVFRYADVLLLKAEAAIRNGGGDAAQYVDEVRVRAMVDPLGAYTLEDILDERARELYGEGHRRSDMIRFGVFNDPRWEFEGSDPACANIWPVPEQQINTNPNLVQNPCY